MIKPNFSDPLDVGFNMWTGETGIERLDASAYKGAIKVGAS